MTLYVKYFFKKANNFFDITANMKKNLKLSFTSIIKKALFDLEEIIV